MVCVADNKASVFASLYDDGRSVWFLDYYPFKYCTCYFYVNDQYLCYGRSVITLPQVGSPILTTGS